ncbi:MULTISPECIES: hypothetical protein [Mycolicibacterium]|nr:hypothetical protein [Mycolicibacterium chitae]
MSNKSRGRGQKKPQMTIKERRAEKRAKFADDGSVASKRKRDRV